MNIKGIVFDLDGTLADSIEDIAESMNQVLEEQNLAIHSIDTYKTFVGNGIRKLVKRSLPEELRTDELFTKNLNRMLEVYGANCINKTKLYPGVADLLDQLQEKEIKISVFSNKANDLTHKVVKVLLAKWDVSFVIGAGGDVARKPNPQGALMAAEKMKISPNKLMFVGDSGVDMETAKNAGMFGVGVLWGFRGSDELKANGAKAIISEASELLNHL
ncbi:HAD family hydrolase [Ancylomarina euxinus]|uniref:phosphoglycolate phosphatase n=1 Tax=Ancylomarina euxinus TaxID=2283627 RepID=A0A425XYZ6_9BACT|nr:HAD family hydrolase [Ancylomarina euxinus]MCZ4695562.1 HAD family hydrolase [Ancylomarina euxinus]MUP15943.1 HAD-IIIA family hydrolase [Ancylomarina euxinus]RRG20384.1 HAD family hydrolase [Ancylomarina euxinus]